MYIPPVLEDMKLDNIQPRPMDPLDSDLSASLKILDTKQKLIRVLPAIDCGGCGYPACESLALAIARNEAGLQHCVFLRDLVVKVRGNSSLKEDPDINIWGKEKFDKLELLKQLINENK